ncbi:MAG TPA: SIMPL domain-containing protein [Sphingomonas sp.]|nr:SIMPL domain-containing protein [Sphingomonas sp.]
MRKTALMLLAIAAPANAQEEPAQRATINVVGYGKVTSPPTVAVIDYWVAGEGKTPDAASEALAEKQRTVSRGVAGLLGRDTQITGGNVIVIEARSPECKGPNSYGAQPQLSEGACTVTGYIATLQGNVRTSAVTKAGTAVGLAARLGARDARLQQFLLADQADAQRRAMADALKDARSRAEALATGSGARLGDVVSIRDQNSGMRGELMVTGANARMASPPPPPAPPPVEIELTPRPIETQAQVYVSYAIAR